MNNVVSSIQKHFLPNFMTSKYILTFNIQLKEKILHNYTSCSTRI